MEFKLFDKVIIKAKKGRPKKGDWISAYNNLKGVVVKIRDIDPYGNNRLIKVSYSKLITSNPENNDGWFKKTELKLR